jgi:GNAT superfamily N-acetyltransferase
MTRVADPAEAFVYDSWCRSLIDALTDEDASHFELANVLAESMNGTLHAGVRRYVGRLLSSAQVHVYIAAASDDPQALLAWIAAEPTRLHYVYVKKRLRGHGVARDLFQHAEQQLGPFRSTSTLTRGWMRDAAADHGISYSPLIQTESELAQKEAS